MDIFYHGTSVIFKEFDLSHALEGDGKVKFGYGIYVTQRFATAAHYANPKADHHYVYTVEVPAQRDDNFIPIKGSVNPDVVKRAEEKLGETIPPEAAAEGKLFRKFLAIRLAGKGWRKTAKPTVADEKKASEFLSGIGVDFLVWPVNWQNPQEMNRAILDDGKVRIVKIEEVQLDEKGQLIPGSEREMSI